MTDDKRENHFAKFLTGCSIVDNPPTSMYYYQRKLFTSNFIDNGKEFYGVVGKGFFHYRRAKL